MPETRTLRAYIELVGKEQFEKELKNIQAKGETSAGGVEQAFDKANAATMRWGEKLGRLGSDLTQYVTLPLVALSAGALKITTDVLNSNEAIAKLSTEGRANAGALLRQWDELKGGLGEVRNELVEGMLPVYRDLVAFANDELVPVLKKITTGFSDQSTAAKEAQIKCAAFIGVLGPGIKVVSDIAIAMAALKYILGATGVAAAIAFAPLAAVIGLIVWGGAVVVDFYQNMKEFWNYKPRPLSEFGAKQLGAEEGTNDYEVSAPPPGWKYHAAPTGGWESTFHAPPKAGGYTEPWQESITVNQIAEAQRRWGPITSTAGGGAAPPERILTREEQALIRFWDRWQSIQDRKMDEALDAFAKKIQGIVTIIKSVFGGTEPLPPQPLVIPEPFAALKIQQMMSPYWSPPANEYGSQAPGAAERDAYNALLRRRARPRTEYAFGAFDVTGAEGLMFSLERTAKEDVPTWQTNEFLWQTAFAAAGPLMQGGSARDALGAVLPGIGFAVGGPVGGGIGMILAGLLGKKQRGETAANPVYVKDINTGNLLTELLNATKSNVARAGASVIDRLTSELRMQSLRRGLT